MGNQATGVTVKTKFIFSQIFAKNQICIQKIIDKKFKNS